MYFLYRYNIPSIGNDIIHTMTFNTRAEMARIRFMIQI